MRIRRPRNLSNGQIALVTVLGVLGGVYIWRPLIEETFIKRRTAAASTENPSQ